mgnify:CR=1 FL=1
MEYLDVLDSEGRPIGKTKNRFEIHRDGDWHRAVHVWIITSKGELLIQKRAREKESNPNKWDISSAGHVLAGTDSIDAVIREVKEELGLELNKEDFEYLFTVKSQSVLNNGTYINNEFDDVYLVRRDLDIHKMTIQKEEVSEIKLINFKELEQLISVGDQSFVAHPEEFKRLFTKLNEQKSR